MLVLSLIDRDQQEQATHTMSSHLVVKRFHSATVASDVSASMSCGQSANTRTIHTALHDKSRDTLFGTRHAPTLVQTAPNT